MTSLAPNVDAWSAEARERHARLYADATRPLSQLVHVEDPAFFVDPWPVYERMQNEQPVYFDAALNTWILTKYADVQYAARHPEYFSVTHGKLLFDGVKSGSGLSDIFAGGGDIIGLTDPPRHGELRRVMQPPFTPPFLARLEARIASHCDAMLDTIVPGEPVNWAETVATRLPILILAEILGIPAEDDEFFVRVKKWADAAEDLASLDLTPEQIARTKEEFGNINGFISEMFETKRRDPGDDFLTSLLNDHLDNTRLSDANLVGFAQLLISAGADTSRAMIAELIAHLAMFPDQRDLLKADPRLIPGAIEEVLRFCPPPRGFARQVVQETELNGQTLRVGERIWMAFDAANRDPDMFENPHVFDIQRTNSRKNLAFGFGTHVCIAAPLVRLETRILLEKIMVRYPRFEFAGPGKRIETFLRNSWHDLPVVFYSA